METAPAPMPGRRARTPAKGALQRPPADSHSHDAAIQRLVDQELRLRGAERAEQHDPLPQLGLAVLDQLARRALGQAVAFAGVDPRDGATIELDADVTDVARADVMRPGMRRRAVREAARRT